MPNPTGSDRRIDSALADVSIAHMQDHDDALYGKIAPVLKVPKSTGKYFTYPTKTWNKRQARRRAPGAKAAEGQFTTSNDPYSCELFSITHKDPREESEQADEAIEPRIEATEWGAGQVLMEADDLVTTAMLGPAIWDTDVDGTTGAPVVGTSVLQWDQAGSDPITDMVQLNGLIKKKSTKWANICTLGFDVWTILINHPAIVDRIKHTSSNSVRRAILAGLFEVEEVIVPGLTENTAELGQTESMDFIAGAKDVGLFYIAKSPGKRVLSAAYAFAYNVGDYKEGVRISEWYDKETNSDKTQTDLFVDIKVVATSAGAFIDDAVA